MGEVVFEDPPSAPTKWARKVGELIDNPNKWGILKRVPKGQPGYDGLSGISSHLKTAVGPKVAMGRGVEGTFDFITRTMDDHERRIYGRFNGPVPTERS